MFSTYCILFILVWSKWLRTSRCPKIIQLNVQHKQIFCKGVRNCLLSRIFLIIPSTPTEYTRYTEYCHLSNFWLCLSIKIFSIHFILNYSDIVTEPAALSTKHGVHLTTPDRFAVNWRTTVKWCAISLLIITATWCNTVDSDNSSFWFWLKSKKQIVMKTLKKHWYSWAWGNLCQRDGQWLIVIMLRTW